MSARIVRIIPCGESVTVKADEAPDGWVAVDGGYVRREYLK